MNLKLHPDKHHASSNTGQADRVENKTIHSRFVAVNEAYAVLSKPETKRIYDLGLPSVDQEEQWRSRRAGWASFRAQFQDLLFIFFLFRSSNYQEMPDFHQRARAMGYGVNPAYYEKVSNADRFKILGFCASLVVLGYFIRHTIVEAAYNQNKRALQETNKAAMSALDESRARAIELGSLKEQVENFEKRYDMARADQKTATTPSMRAAQKTTTTTTTTPSMLPENGPAS